MAGRGEGVEVVGLRDGLRNGFGTWGWAWGEAYCKKMSQTKNALTTKLKVFHASEGLVTRHT